MSGVREFRQDDVSSVAALWMRVFRRMPGPAATGLQEYFRDIFFDSPWRDSGQQSLVYENEAGHAAGFLGVIPRKMRFKGAPIKVAVATQLMVDEETTPAYVAAKLVRRFLAGPQDLSLSDGANEAGGKLWRACGGEAALLYSFNWTRALRPAQFLNTRLKARRRIGVAALPFSPVAWAMDACAELVSLSYWMPQAREAERTRLSAEALSEESLMQCMDQLGGRRALQPEYDRASLHWLLRQAGEKKNHGALKTALLRLQNGSIAGWYLCYMKAGGTAQVLQYGARPDSFRAVMDHLFHSAWIEGAVAVTGGLEPRFATELASLRCRITLPGYGVLMHSRHGDIAHAIHRGDAFLSRLEGEWWARFSDREWSEVKAVASPVIHNTARAPQLKAAHLSLRA